MADSGGSKRWLLIALFNFLLSVVLVSADRSQILQEISRLNETRRSFSDGQTDINFETLIATAKALLWQPDVSSYQPVWPDMELGWRIVVGTVIAFIGGAFGSVGGIGGGGFFLPMLNLIIGFDAKSSTAISKCMIMGAAISTVYYNLKQRHPTIDMPIIDYDLVLLIQPMLILGISIGVIFNVVFPDWIVTILLLILFLFISTKAFFMGVETWKKETIMLKEAAKLLNETNVSESEYKHLPSGPETETKQAVIEVPILQNVYWKELGFLVFVWITILLLQFFKNKTPSCSWGYWILNLLQIPVCVGVSLNEAVSLYKGRRVIASLGDRRSDFRIFQLGSYMFLGMAAGVVGGLLGVGGGSIMGPLFLELGVHPQVASASATFAMTFSSSMSVVEYYLLNRFPVPYAVYLASVALIAAYSGQHVVGKAIALCGRASIIIFVLSFSIFLSSLTLGGVGISNSIQRLQRNDYMGFDSLC